MYVCVCVFAWPQIIRNSWVSAHMTSTHTTFSLRHAALMQHNERREHEHA